MIQQSKSVNTGNVNTGGGDFHLGDNFYKSLEYKELTERIEEMRDFMQSTTDEVKRLKYNQKLNDLQHQLEAFKRDVIRLSETFQNANLNNEVMNLAKQKYDEGKFKEAHSLLEAEQITNGLDVLLERKEKVQQDLRDKSDELLLLAQLTVVDYKLEKKRYTTAKQYFEQSLKANRNVNNISTFAFFLQKNNQITQAIPLYEEALAIYRKLNEEDKRHLLNIASALNNLGILYSDKNKYKKAEQFYEEALDIIRQLAQVNPQTFLRDIGLTLNNLGLLYWNKNEYEKAEQACEEALTIYRQLAQVNSQTFLPDLASTLSNLGILYSDKNKYKKAGQFYEEALDIRRQLAQINPQAFLPDLGLTLNNLGILYKTKNEYEKAEQFYEEALGIRRQLAQVNPQTFLPDVSTTLNNLGILYVDKNEYQKAGQAHEEALAIRQKFAELFPEVYEIPLASSHLSLSILYRHNLADKEKSLQNAKKAIALYSKYPHVPYAVKWGNIAQKHIDSWGNENPK